MNDHRLEWLLQLIEESEVMVKHAYGSGMRVPDDVTEVLHETSEILSHIGEAGLAGPSGGDHVIKVSRIHGQLAQMVAPALPRTLKLIHDENMKSGWKHWRSYLGPVPLVQGMVIAALICLSGFVILSALDRPEAATDALERLGELLVLVFAAGMGAAYLILYKTNRYIVKGTYDPKYNSSYWIRFILGIISGVILAQIISQTQEELQEFGKVLLALIGGFSAAVVYRILTKLVDAVESIFRGDESERIEANERAAKARLEEKNAQERLDIAADLMSLSQTVGADNTEHVMQKINEIYAKLMPFVPESIESEEVVESSPGGENGS